MFPLSSYITSNQEEYKPEWILDIMENIKEKHIFENFSMNNLSNKINNLTEVKIGPFNLSGDPITKIFIYNPSIELGKDGKLYCVSRLTGRHSQECKYSFSNKDFKKSNIIDNEIKRFPINYRKEISSVVYFPLDNPTDFKILYEFDMNNLCTDKWIIHSPEAQGLEDPRLFTFKDELWVYSHYRGGMKNICQHIPIIFKVSDPKHVMPLTLNNMTELEKNWMPFEYEGELYFEYNIYPHTILNCDIETGICNKVYETNSVGKDIISTNHLGGGSPSKLFSDADGLIGLKNKKYFLGFAHTRLTSPVIRKNFFYIFNSTPPFEIIMIGSEIDILNTKTDIEFGSGMVIVDNKTVLVSVGISDCYGIIKELSLKEIIKSLRRIDLQNGSLSTLKFININDVDSKNDRNVKNNTDDRNSFNKNYKNGNMDNVIIENFTSTSITNKNTNSHLFLIFFLIIILILFFVIVIYN
jgi:hypothetical protein